MTPLLNKNRLNNALSKTGALSPERPERRKEVLELLVVDVLEELEKRQEEALKSLKGADRSLFLELLRDSAQDLISSEFGAP